jgi:hypothetical protein
METRYHWNRLPAALLLVLALLAFTLSPALAATLTAADRLTSTDVGALARTIRVVSQADAQLTPLASLKLGGSPLDAAQQDGLVAAIQADRQYQDLRLLATPSGTRYLYSTSFISDTYSHILLLVETGDPYAMMADIARENSQLYPRPTPVAMFALPLFRLPADQVEQIARDTVQKREYGDVHLFTTSSGSLYLYSDRYMNEDWARSIAEMDGPMPGQASPDIPADIPPEDVRSA